MNSHQSLINALKNDAIWTQPAKEPYLPDYVYGLCRKYSKTTPAEQRRKQIPVRVSYKMPLFGLILRVGLNSPYTSWGDLIDLTFWKIEVKANSVFRQFNLFPQFPDPNKRLLRFVILHCRGKLKNIFKIELSKFGLMMRSSVSHFFQRQFYAKVATVKIEKKKISGINSL